MRNLLVATLLVCSNAFAVSLPITVVGEGKDVTQAKNNAFQKAIEQEVGVALLSHKNVKSSKLVADDIVIHSAGYVDDFKITKTEVINNVYYVTVNVWVKSSRIHERVLGATTDAKFANGEKITEQYQTYNNTKKTGDDVLTTVLADYPKSAFIAKFQKIDNADVITMVDEYRNPVFIANFNVSYNYNFLQSLNEALKLTSDKKIRNSDQQTISIRSNKPKSFFNDNDTYYINDADRANLIKNAFIMYVQVKLIALDSSGNPLFHGCSNFFQTHDAILLKNNFGIDGTEKFENELVIKRKQGDPLIQKVNSFRLTIEAGPCYN